MDAIQCSELSGLVFMKRFPFFFLGPDNLAPCESLKVCQTLKDISNGVVESGAKVVKEIDQSSARDG